MSNRILTFAASLIFISAALHFVAPLVSGFSVESLMLLPFWFVYAFLAWQVWKNKRWAAWLGFFLMLFGGIVAMSLFLTESGIPNWVTLVIWLVDWEAAICLLISLWRDHQVKPLSTQR